MQRSKSHSRLRAPLYSLLWLPMIAATALLWVQAMYRGQVISYGQGVLAAIVSARRMRAARTVIQATRTVKAGEIAAALAWSPLKLLTRAIVLRRS
jgi:N-acetylglucosaminyl-diphospho-decaprenol L-rhamnosyltransferase